MAPSLLDVSQRILAWMIVFLAALGALGNAAQGVLDGRRDHFWLWLGIAVAAALVATQAEKVKGFLEARTR